MPDQQQEAIPPQQLVPARVWAATRELAGHVRDRLEVVHGRPVTLRETWHVAVRIAASASDEELKRGEL